jgi:hypothetical protein
MYSNYTYKFTFGGEHSSFWAAPVLRVSAITGADATADAASSLKNLSVRDYKRSGSTQKNGRCNLLPTRHSLEIQEFYGVEVECIVLNAVTPERFLVFAERGFFSWSAQAESYRECLAILERKLSRILA